MLKQSLYLMSLSLFSTISIIIFSYTGFIWGILLARVAPEELKDAKRILNKTQILLYCIFASSILLYMMHFIKGLPEEIFLTVASLVLITSIMQGILLHARALHKKKKQSTNKKP